MNLFTITYPVSQHWYCHLYFHFDLSQLYFVLSNICLFNHKKLILLRQGFLICGFTKLQIFLRFFEKKSNYNALMLFLIPYHPWNFIIPEIQINYWSITMITIKLWLCYKIKYSSNSYYVKKIKSYNSQ